MRDPYSISSKIWGPRSVYLRMRSHIFDSKHDGRVSTKQRETRIQHCMSLRHKMPKSPHPQGFETSSSDALSMDLRDYLTRKRNIHQIAPDVTASSSSQQYSLIAIATFRQINLQFSAGYQRLQTQPRDNDPRKRDHSLTSSSQKWLQRWCGWVPRQASPSGSNWLLVSKSRMLIGLQVWRMPLPNLKGSTDTLRPTWKQIPQSTIVCWPGELRWMMSTLPSSSPGL